MPEILQHTVDAIPGLAWSALPDGRLDSLNQRWCDYTGLSLDEARGFGWRIAIHPDDLPAVLGHWHALLAAGQPGETEARLRRSDGAYRWFVFRLAPLRDDTGRVRQWYGQSIDIDDRRRAEALLAGEKRLLEMVAGECPLHVVLDALCTVVEETAGGCHCSVLLVDPAGTRLLHGAAPSLPARFNEAVHGLAVPPLQWIPCGATVQHRSQVIVEDIALDTRWTTAEWRDFALELGLRSCWSTPILSLAGRVIGTFAIYQRQPGCPTPLEQNLIERFTHIARIAIERAENEAALKRSEAFLLEAQRLSLTGSFSWRSSSNEMVWSEQTYRVYGVEPGTLISFELMASRIHPDETAWLLALIKRARQDKVDLEFEHRLQMPDRSIKHLRVVARAMHDHDGEFEYIGAVQDVTERRQSDDALNAARSELVRVTRMTTLGALTASIAHEVSQPLSGIITNSSISLRMLTEDPPDLEGAQETARRALRDANRASDVVHRLRALFRRTSTASETLDLNDATREVLMLSRSELQRAGIVVREDLASNIPTVKGDRVQLQQVVMNLIRNASDAMHGTHDRPRLLVVRTTLDDDQHVRLTVEDRGTGFEPQIVNRLFDAFYTTKDEGMGMGLSISRSIIEGHEGRLWASLNEGPGAAFSFSIPQARSGTGLIESA